VNNLQWWKSTLKRTDLYRPIPKPVQLIDLAAYSNASSGVGIAITIRERWHAWRLVPGWQSVGDLRDIAWAEAIGFELLVYAITRDEDSQQHYGLHGDNKGVVEGWWNGRSCNSAVNDIFKRLHKYLSGIKAEAIIHTVYIPSANNPADLPSQGIYASTNLLLPYIKLAPCIQMFLMDSTEPYTPTELRLHHEGKYPRAVAKHIDDAIEHSGAWERFSTKQSDEATSPWKA